MDNLKITHELLLRQMGQTFTLRAVRVASHDFLLLAGTVERVLHSTETTPNGKIFTCVVQETSKKMPRRVSIHT